MTAEQSPRASGPFSSLPPSAVLDGSPGRGHAVLVVDDSRLQRRILCAQLRTLGFEVREAESGEEALAICAADPPDMVVSDWMMPGMDGPEFCQRFRRMPRESYGYFVLLTAKSDRGEIATGFEAGADDFLTKPVQSQELRARLAAGARVLRMEKELVEKNQLLSSTLEELRQLYDSLDKDLIEARKLQQSLVKDRSGTFRGSDVSLLLRPSGHVGGDLVGFFPVGEDRLCLFAIDVSGHGVASALMTARLSSYLMPAGADRNVALYDDGAGGVACHSPAEVARRLNAISLAELATDTYFTMLFAEVRLTDGSVRMVQAGHPHPLLQRIDGSVQRLGAGGVPIGLIDEAEFEEITFTLSAGERLLIVSDGITECEDREGRMLEEAGLVALVQENAGMRGQGFLEGLTWGLATHADGEEFGDDISAVLFEYRGPEASAGAEGDGPQPAPPDQDGP